MINNYMNKSANKVIIDNLNLFAEAIKNLYNISEETASDCFKNPKSYTLYALVSNKKLTLRFEIKEITEKVNLNYTTERYLITTINNNRCNGLASWDLVKLEKHIQEVMKKFTENCEVEK